MKKILYFLSLAIVLSACSETETDSLMPKDKSTIEMGLISPVLQLSDQIQSSHNDHIEVESVRTILKEIDHSKIEVTENNEFIVELNLSFSMKELEELKKNLITKYNSPLIDGKLTSWYLHSASGKELEISLIESDDISILRFLMRAYL